MYFVGTVTGCGGEGPDNEIGLEVGELFDVGKDLDSGDVPEEDTDDDIGAAEDEIDDDLGAADDETDSDVTV